MPAIILSFLGICVLALLILLVVAYGSRRKDTKEVGLASDIVNHLNGDSKPLGLLVDIYEEIPDLVDLPKPGISSLNFFHKEKDENSNSESANASKPVADSGMDLVVPEDIHRENAELNAEHKLEVQKDSVPSRDDELSENDFLKARSEGSPQENPSDITALPVTEAELDSDNYDTVIMEAISEPKDSDSNPK